MENEYQLWEKVFSDFSKQAKSLRKENRESVLEGIKENDKNAWEELMVYYLPSLVQIYQKEVPESICEEVPFDEYIIKFQEKFYQRIHHGQIDNRYLYLELSKSAKSVIQHIKKERKKESKIRVEDIMEMDKHPKYATMMELVPDLEEVLNQNLKTEYVSILCEYFGIQTKPLSIKELAHKYQLKEGKIQSMVNAGIAALRTKKVFTEVLEAYGYTPDEISKRKQDMKYFTKKSSALKEQNMGTYIYHPAQEAETLANLKKLVIKIYDLYDGDEERLIESIGISNFKKFEFLNHVFYWDKELYSGQFHIWENFAYDIYLKMVAYCRQKQKKL